MTVVFATLLAAALLSALEAIVGTLRVGRLLDEAPLAAAEGSTVSVVIAARNEAEHVETALASVLAQDHPRLEFIVVDDRSEDETGAILERIARREPRLVIRHVTVLPGGWLGKNHALQAGAAVATGEWLLFTDADVRFEASAIRRAVSAATRRRLDMLACTPRIVSPSWAVRGFVAGFALFFGLFTRPWRVRDPRSTAAMGIGAFNLVRTVAYRAADGHASIRLRPDDDLMLGRLIKRRGGRCDVLFGAGLLSVAWYPSLGALVQGLMKNCFAGVGYRVTAVIGSVVGLLAIGTLPTVLAIALPGPLGLAAVAVCAVQAVAAVVSTRSAGLAPAYGLGLPVSAVLFSWILVRATVVTLWQGGIYWRGTFYALDDLKRNRL